MWFNNVLLFRFELDKDTDIGTLLAEESLKPCPPHARFTYGWLPIYNDCFAHEVAGATLICMGKEERVLPRSVIHREMEERIAAQEAQLLRPLKRSEKSQMAEEIEFELLPKAFCLQKRMQAILDTKNNHLILNTSSQAQAEQFTSLLRKTITGIRIEPIPIVEHIASRFAEWITSPASIPSAFQLGENCVLFSPDDEKKKFNCKGYELPAEEVLSLLSQGLKPAEITVQWDERVQFTLTQELTFKRIKCLDVLVDAFHELKDLDEENQERDAALTLLSGELRAMISVIFNYFEKQRASSSTSAVVLEPA